MVFRHLLRDLSKPQSLISEELGLLKTHSKKKKKIIIVNHEKKPGTVTCSRFRLTSFRRSEFAEKTNVEEMRERREAILLLWVRGLRLFG